jgi:hypothetical protein
MIRFATVAIAAGMLGACVPPLPGGSLDDGTGGGGASSSGAGASPAGTAGLPDSSGRAASPGSTGGGGSGPGPACTAAPLSCTAQPMCPEPTWTGSPVSSFESDCNTVDPVDGRDGGWYVYTTANTTASPGPMEPFRATCPGAAGSCFANCVSGTLNGNGGDWPTAGLGFAPRLNAAAYDVSRYSAIDFWLHTSVGPGSTLRLLVPLKADTMVGNGDGTCTTNCFDAYSMILPPAPGWQHVTVPFASLRQQGFGAPEPWDPTTVISVQWGVSATANPDLSLEPYIICVDQVQLLP